VRQSPAGKDMSMKSENMTLLEAVTRQQLVKTKIRCVLKYSDLYSV
jgi:hypothetical protein